jgi:SAM-dependent methyltransferase
MVRRPNYGIDSPGIVIGLFVASALALAAGIVFPHVFGLRARWLELLASGYFLAGASGMLAYSRSGKLRIRDQILNAIPWRGDEIVLDVGCGRGLLLVGAARRLTAGRAIGVDIWAPGAVTGNRPEAVLENAASEGVADRVELGDGDARHLPFKDNAFDVVVSNYLIHEVNTAADRQQIISEVVRILKPGGHLAVVDFIFTKECVAAFQRAGIATASRARLGTLSFWVGAVLSFGSCQNYLIAGCKPLPG